MRIYGSTSKITEKPMSPDSEHPPLPYPTGWFCLAMSAEVTSGKVITRRLAGEDVVLYRLRSGDLQAVRPFCPHLGAHLGAGGTVKGDTLVCPFHGFAFGSDGVCVKAYISPPPKIALDQHSVRETLGMIWVWHGQDGVPPTWDPLDLPADGFPAPTRRTMDLASHPQIILENAIDTGHAVVLHGFTDVKLLGSIKRDGIGIFFQVRAGRAWVGPVRQVSVAMIRLWELGCACATFGIPGVRIRVFMLPVPTDQWKTKLHFACSTIISRPQWLPAPLGRLVVRVLASVVTTLALLAVCRDARMDQMIWNFMRYNPHPKLAKGDGPIGTYRKWARQFYPPFTPLFTTDNHVSPSTPQDEHTAYSS